MKKASDVAIDGRFRIIEIYPAYQGEGTLLGVPTLFVRFAGCTVGCQWCDTKYSWKADQGLSYTPAELADRIFTEGLPHVVLTGGEPFEQPHDMLAAFHDVFNWQSRVFHITYETSGIAPPDDWIFSVRQRVLMSVSPKLPSAHANYEFPDLRLWVKLLYGKHDAIDLQFKFVIGANDEMEPDLRYVEAVLEPLYEEHEYAMGKVPIILQPCTPFIRGGRPQEYRDQIAHRTLALQEWLDKQHWTTHQPNLRVIPQFHAMLHGSKRGI